MTMNKWIKVIYRFGTRYHLSVEEGKDRVGNVFAMPLQQGSIGYGNRLPSGGPCPCLLSLKYKKVSSYDVIITD